MKDMPALAFPHKWETTDGTTIIAKGMTLRDYFAGKMLQGVMGTVFIKGDKPPSDEIVESCYAWADAMMKAREA